jgi:hypothetical protein
MAPALDREAVTPWTGPVGGLKPLTRAPLGE